MRKLACLFFPEGGVVKEMDIRAENIGALEADVGLAVPAADAWVHVNAGLPCQDGSKANHRRKPAQLREHVATFFIFIRRLQAKYRKVTWFAENVACPEFAEAMKGLFPEATCAGVQAQRGHSRSKHIDAAVSSWVVVSEPRSDVRGGEVGPMILRAYVSVPLHPRVDVTWGGAVIS